MDILSFILYLKMNAFGNIYNAKIYYYLKYDLKWRIINNIHKYYVFFQSNYKKLVFFATNNLTKTKVNVQTQIDIFSYYLINFNNKKDVI